MKNRVAATTFAIAFSVAAATAHADDFKPEEGFTLLFNGKDLTGWKTTKGESLDGKTEAYAGRFKAADGILTLDPSVKGDVRIVTAKEFTGDVHLKFDFMPGPKCNNDLFLRGTKFDLKIEDVKEWKEGEWNTCELVLKDGKVEFKVNGKSIRTLPAKEKSSSFQLRAEIGPMKVRHLRVKE
jgi:hypothetical protein